MQVKIRTGSGKAFNLNALKTAFSHKADGSGVFEAGQHPIIVGQAAYNSAYGTSFVSEQLVQRSGNHDHAVRRVRPDLGAGRRHVQVQHAEDGHQRHDRREARAEGDPRRDELVELRRVREDAGDPRGRGRSGHARSDRTSILHPFVYPGTEVIDATKLPTADVKVTPIASGDDGTQIWKITHNGVDTHPIHFHAYDVQVLNRVTWDNIIIAAGRDRARVEGHRADQPAARTRSSPCGR